MNSPQNELLVGVWHVIFPDDSEGVIVNGVAVIGSQHGKPPLDIKAIAEAIANAQNTPLQRVYLPQPALHQWGWDDIPATMVSAVSSTIQRCSIIVICSELSSGRAIHFCGHPVLTGSCHHIWFSVQDGETWFEAVERVMVMNHQAVNVVRLEPLHTGGEFCDQKVIYNGHITKLDNG